MSEKGFTLLEVLIALVLFAIISIGVYSLLNQSLFMENYANKRLDLILASTNFVYLYWDNPPDETFGWKNVNEYGIDYMIKKTPLGFENIVKVDWIFKKNSAQIGYVLYY